MAADADKPNKRIKLRPEIYQQIQCLFKQLLKKKKLEKQKKEVENQFKKQKQENQKLEIEIESKKTPVYTNSVIRKPHKKNKAILVAGRRRPPRRTRTAFT